MVRALIYLLLIAAVAIGLAWFADRPGELTINWLSYQIEVPLFWITVGALIALGLLLFVFSFISRLVSGPQRLRRHMKKKRQERGYEALRKGIFAVGAGDEAVAARYAIEARRALPKEPLTELLRAQSAQLSGDRRTAQRIFEAMADQSDTRLLGLRGLFLEASREGESEAARQFAARAMSLNPALPWPVHALFDMQCRSRNWQGALETLAIARNNRHLDRKTADRRRAVLLTAQAHELEASQSARAVELAFEAHRIAPDFVPAATLAGRVLAGQGNAYKAARVLARTWQYTPHPDLALGYAYARPGDSPRDRLARIRSLIVLTPDHVEARIALASAAVDAREWNEARAALLPLIAKNPTAKVCALMARIEGGEKRDAGRVREWLARAIRAPRDAVWMADGVVSNDWDPISPVSGALDAFEWRVPPDQSRAGLADALLDEVSALSQELDGVALKISETNIVDPAGKDAGAASQPLTITIVAEDVPAAQVKPPVQPAKKPEEKSVVVEAAKVVSPSVAVSAKPSVDKLVAAETRGPSDGKPSGAGPAGAVTQQAAASQAIAPRAPETTAAQPAPQPAKPAAKLEAKIFVPDRPPDDPGPVPADLDETSTPYTRFRSSLKQQTS
jgi:HemY protein